MVNKKVLLYWTICSFILVTGIHYLDGWMKIDDWFIFSLAVFFAVLLLVVASIILSVIIASYPFNDTRTPGKKKVRSFLPVSTVVLTVVSFIAFIVSRPSYARETPAESRLCQSVKEGTFQLDEYRIVRIGNIHTETDVNTGEKTAYKVKWLTDCEFELANMKDHTDVTKIKIISVSNGAYECVATFDGRRTTKHKLIILRDNN